MDTNTLPTGDGSLSPSMITRIDEACDRFEEAWKAGLRPRIEEYLEVTPEPERSLLWHELLVLEIAYRRRQGERPTPEEDRARSPEHVNPIEQIVGETDPTESLNGPGPTLTDRPKAGIQRAARVVHASTQDGSPHGRRATA